MRKKNYRYGSSPKKIKNVLRAAMVVAIALILVGSALLLMGGTKGESGSCPWDLNNDGFVNALDALMVASHWGETGYPGWILEDLSGPKGIPDGEINIFDIFAISDHWL